MTKPRIREVIVVEGRYDKNAVSQVVDALIFETGGFAIFHQEDKLAALRLLAQERGLIVLTDSDGAGFVIRNRLKSLIPEGTILQAYIPAISGKEKRKAHPSRQGLLGVEGMRPETILSALQRAGAALDNATPTLTTADFFRLGLTGKSGSAELRRRLAESLDLPAGISQSDLKKTLPVLLTKEELETLLSRLTIS